MKTDDKTFSNGVAMGVWAVPANNSLPNPFENMTEEQRIDLVKKLKEDKTSQDFFKILTCPNPKR